MTVDVIIEDTRWAEVDIETTAQTATDATLTALGLDTSDFEVSLLACADERIAVLNGDFRAKPTPTNVLSWPSMERGALVDGDRPTLPKPSEGEELGDLALAYETCKREAEDGQKPFGDHVLHLIVHGTLHLLGYDHVRDGDAALMEDLERQILGKLGLPDPYSD